MNRTDYEIALLEARQTLREYLSYLKDCNCISLIRFMQVTKHLNQVEGKLRAYEDELRLTNLM